MKKIGGNLFAELKRKASHIVYGFRVTLTDRPADAVKRLLKIAMGREATNDELLYWVPRYINMQGDLAAFAGLLADQSWFQVRFGGLKTDVALERHVYLMYEIFFDRVPSTSEVSYWATQNMKLTAVFASFAQSNEFLVATGSVMGFTSNDESFDYLGVTYKPTNGFMGTAAASKNNLSVDNISATSMITAMVSEADLRSGRMDNAKVEVFWICPEHPEYGIVPIRGGRFGQVTIKNGQYEVELRANSYFLQQPYGRFFTQECSAQLGDNLCKVHLNPKTWQPATNYAAACTGPEAGIGSWVVPRGQNGFWYRCTRAGGGRSLSGNYPWGNATKAPTPGVYNSMLEWALAMNSFFMSGSGQGGGSVGPRSVTTGNAFQTVVSVGNVDQTGTYGDSAAYLTPTKQYEAPLSAPSGSQPLTTTTRSARIVLYWGTSGATEPVWPLSVGASVTDGNLVWTAYPARVMEAQVTAVYNKGEFEASSLGGYNEKFFKYGSVEWTSGRNAGFRMEVRDFVPGQRGFITLLEQMPFKVMVGDAFRVSVGCSKTRMECRNKFQNLNNFRGFPDMPTEDRALQTPNFQQQGTESDPNEGGGS